MPPVAEELEGQIDARANAAPSSIPNLIRRRRCNMVRAPCCDKAATKKGPWEPEEDAVLVSYIRRHGHSNWRALPKLAGLLRCGKSCRLRWMNYLRPDIKRGNFSEEEEATIIRLHQAFGNRWSTIAANLPGRTDNEIKNVWHTHLKKLLSPGQPEAKRRRTSNKSKQVATVPKISSVSDLSPCASVDSPAASGLSSEKGGSFCSVEEFPAIQESLWMDSASYIDMDFTGSLLVPPPVADSDDMEFWLQVLRRAEDQVEEQPLF